ncbi:protein-L-isoaspartate O-methyltransferase domain-containing protein 1-like [Mercenaria mercenaria]|uniref:protein-L-isoaspartate O-methyltransferase domain-containing protein 1-like n=1 Tax=Mercenaria mercenaria TaxID=6596 RepID=UPI00234EA094|nr:protein-L-isoaspartate O-methyltransferase domain-containing protein 1-like [Mercenaria mercenaria]XP_045157376.2 protein-L-isoaspartate O-methyltransferase domain-containing protein 1-like [Mercenaria mercenaria]XP_045157378.2 protein-L-isoaspartate O-methyltransferase domain-containing protein 1-like [Mercenaria mercenaria]
MGGAVSTGSDNDDLVDNLVEADYIKTPLVEKVFRAVDRADYYLPDQRESAYKDLAWKHEHLHMSAPCIYSEVMEALQLEPSLSFLNLGSGTGYLSTMVGLILGPYGVNHGIEQHDDVVQYARERLAEFKHNSSAFDEFDFCEPKFIVGNCLQLNSGCQLYDRVYVGAGCPPEHENYMKNMLKIGGVLVMPLNDRLIQAKRVSETEWDIKNKLPVSFATLVSPGPDAPPDLFDLPEPEQPTLQELCRTSVRRVLRTNIHREHPELTKVRKRPKKPKKKTPKGLSNLNIVPLSMGMMILHQFDRDNSVTDSDEEPGRRDEENETDDNVMDGVEDSNDGIEGKFSTDEEEKEDEEVLENKKAADNNVSKNHERQEVVEKGNGLKGNGIEKVSEKQNDKDSDLESDYGSDEEEKINEAIDSVAEVNASTDGVKKRVAQTTSKIDEIIANVMASCSPERSKDPLQNLAPPDAHWSDTDEDDGDDDKKYNIEEFIKYGARGKNLEPPRKSRYSSSTSVDTSTTSGIGSFVEEHLEEEMGQCDSEKTSPGWNQLEPEAGCSENKPQKMDVEETESEDEKNSDGEDVLKITLSMCMKEAIDSLPLPSAMKSYLRYYRE